MTPKLPNKLEPAEIRSPLALTYKINELVASVNELRDFVEFGTRFIEELHNPKERTQGHMEYTASEQQPHKDIKDGK